MKCKWQRLLAIVLLSFLISKGINAQLSITCSIPAPQMCPNDELNVTITIAETTTTKFPTALGEKYFYLKLPSGLIFSNTTVRNTSPDLQGGYYWAYDDSIRIKFASVSNSEDNDWVAINTTIKSSDLMNTTKNLVVHHGNLYSTPATYSIPIQFSPPSISLSLTDQNKKTYCTKTPIGLSISDATSCSDISAWNMYGINKANQIVNLGTYPSNNDFSISNIDSNLKEIYAFSVDMHGNEFGNASNHLTIGDNTKDLIINSPKLLPFTATDPMRVNRNDGHVPLRTCMAVNPEWQTVYAPGTYTNGPYPFQDSIEGRYHVTFAGKKGTGVVIPATSPYLNSTSVTNDYDLSYFDPTTVGDDNTKIFAITTQYFSNMSGFCTDSSSLTIQISNETISIASSLCASDTAKDKDIVLNGNLVSDYIPPRAHLKYFYVCENGSVIDTLNVDSVDWQNNFHFNLDLKKYKVKKGFTKRMLTLKSIIEYFSISCRTTYPCGWLYFCPPVLTCDSVPVLMEHASKLITIYGPPDNVNLIGLVDTICPSQNPIRLFSNYPIESIEGDGVSSSTTNGPLDWYYKPFDAFGFDFNKINPSEKKLGHLKLHYTHDSNCPDTYEDSVVIKTNYKVDTTGYLKGFPKTLCRSNKNNPIILSPTLTVNNIKVEVDTVPKFRDGNVIYYNDHTDTPDWRFKLANIDYKGFDKDTTLNIIYQYYDGNGCPWVNKIPVIVYDTLRPNFTYTDICNGKTTTFTNTSRAIAGTIGHDSTIIWNFGDYTPISNANTVKHLYREPGKYPLKMLVTSNVGCTSQLDSTIIYGDKTTVDFSVTNHVANTGDPNAQITFHNKSIVAKTATSDTIAVSRYDWNFDDGIASPPIYSPDFIYAYQNAGLYYVKLTATMENGCTESDTIPIPIFPFVNVTNQTPRLYDFESGTQDWLTSGSFKRGQNSTWNYNIIGTALADSVHAESDWAWLTSSIDSAQQVAWVESPCFNIDSLTYPMLNLDIFESVEKGLDGASVQYTYDDGISWHTLGNFNKDIAWYDCEQIQSKPAALTDTANLRTDDGFGWSGNIAKWQNLRYPLEEIKEKMNLNNHPFPCVRFRVKYTTNGSNAPLTTFKGFAFDNFDVTWRKKVMLVEQFTNTVFDATSEQTEFNWLDKYLANYKDGAVAINYHPWISGKVDTLFGINRADISARASEYGILYRPKTILDGYYQSEPPADSTIHHYSAPSSLQDPGFDIHNVDMQIVKDSLVISAGILKLKEQLTPIKETTTSAHYSQDCLVRMAIVQKEMPLNGVDYKNVLIELLPNGEGNTVATIPESIHVGGDTKVISSWKPSVTTVGNHFRLIVYVQSVAGLAKVQQVWYKDIPDALVPQVTKSPMIKSVNSKSSLSVKVYPTPVSDILYVKFDEKAPARSQWQIVNMAGSVVLFGQLEADTQLFCINVSNLSDGVYLLKTTDAVNGTVNTYKVLVEKN